MPSMPEASATAAMSARSGLAEIGRDLDEQRRCAPASPRAPRPARAAALERVARLQLAQPRRVRRRHVDHEIIGNRGAAPHALDVVGHRVGAVAVRADIDPDDARPAGAAPRRRSTARRGRAVEAEPVDQRAVGSRRKTRGRGLPGCGRGVTVPISTKPKPEPQQRSGTRASLSKPAAMPIGFGKSRPQRRVRSTRRIDRACPSAKPPRERSEDQKMRRLGREGIGEGGLRARKDRAPEEPLSAITGKRHRHCGDRSRSDNDGTHRHALWQPVFHRG